MITREEAEAIVYRRINEPDSSWPEKPEFVVVGVSERALGWLVFYDSKLHVDTGDFRNALAGNAPYLVSREDGSLYETGTAPPFDDRVAEAERRVLAQLGRVSQL